MAEEFSRWQRVTGTDRQVLGERVKKMYVEEKMSIREISNALNRSYGSVHALLEECGVSMRPRGNPKG